jgi:uncharacterized protein YaaQ
MTDVQAALLAIVQQADAESATHALTDAGLGITRLSSIGGFLETGNTTLLLGLSRDDVPRTINLLAANCHKRIVFVNAAALAAVDSRMPGFVTPVEAEVGGATILVLPVERFVRVGALWTSATETKNVEDGSMKLILAIVPEERSKRIVDTLVAARYRTTLVSTTGGFLRRGNATLLIGVAAEQVDDVLERIEQACREMQIQASAACAASCATIFVLDVEQYEQV